MNSDPGWTHYRGLATGSPSGTPWLIVLMTAVSSVLPGAAVGVSVGGHGALVGAPGRLDRSVLIGGEDAGESGVLAVGEQADAGAQHSADAVERITDPAGVPAGVLLDALAASVQRIGGQGDNVETGPSPRLRRGFLQLRRS
jgi:hypothetical protein